MPKKFMLIFILLISQYFLIAQEINGNLVTFTEKDGIPSNSIYAILQDHLGFIWIATENGLLKYDGYKFQRYDLAKEIGAPGLNPITSSLFEDSENNLWIGTAFQVIKYNRLEEKFKPYNWSSNANGNQVELGKISAIDEDSTGRIWLGWDKFVGSTIEFGLAYINKGEESINRFYSQNDSSTIREVIDIEIDKNNNLWVSGRDGLSKINLDSMVLEKINFNNSPIRSFNSAILIDDKGILWGCQRGEGFGSYNPINGKVKVYSFNSSNSNSISNNNVHSIVQDKAGTLWLGTNNGVNHFDPETEKFKRYFYHEGLDINYKDIGIVRTLFKDESGSIWLGSTGKFVHKFDPSKILFRSFKHYPNDASSIGPGWTFALAEDSKGNVWIGGIPDEYNSGLTKYNSDTNTITRIQNKNNIYPGIATIYQDSKSTIWMGTFWSGLLTFNPVDNSFHKYIFDFPGTDNNSIIYDILEDHKLNFWIGTENGLFLLNKKNKNAELINLNNNDSLAGNITIQHMVESSKNELWIGTNNGLYKYNYSTKIFKRYKHDSNNPNSLSSSNIGYIYEDKEGILWLGSWGGGLNRFDLVSETFKYYTMEDGLPSNNIQGILGDEEGNALWLSTFEGISRFDLSTKEFRNFDASHGVQGKQFARASTLKTSKGEFLFGGSNGVNIFRPKDVLTNLAPPKILISDFKIFNKSLPIAKGSPLKEPIYQTKKIVLPYDENDISIEFRAIHYVDPTHNKYAYKLENYENEWRYVGNSHSAIYPNLPPGDYVFHVKAANNTGVWNNERKSLEIVIQSPWWKTTLAYIIYGVLFLGFIFGVDRFQRKRLLAKAREKMKIQSAEHRAESAELQAKAAEAQSKVIQAENERKSKELEEARQLQLSMLPKELPQLPHLDIAVYMQTATEVGGDYYDFSIKEDGSLNIALGDATGHGMKAGIMVSSMKSIFTTNSPKMDIEAFFAAANRGIKSMGLERMLMSFTMLNIVKKKLKLINAGMPPVFLFRRKSGSVEEITEHGMPIGAMTLSQYKANERVLAKGDVLLLLSDGMPELQNANKEMYGYKRLTKCFEQIAEKESQGIVDHLKNTASKWVNGNDPDDDVTFVVIKVSG